MSDLIQGDVDSGGVAIHYYRTGNPNKPALLLAHGFSDNGLCWTRVVDAIKADFDVIMVDARNHGQSGRAVGSGDDMADDLAAVIRALDIAPTLALGHSMGASTVLGLAARHPELVKKIILEDPPLGDAPKVEDDATADKRRAGFRDFLANMGNQSDDEILAFGKKQHPTWHDDEFPAWIQSNRQVGEDALAGLKYRDWRDNVRRVQCEALLIYGDEDLGGMLKQPVVDQIVGNHDVFSATQIQGAGHNIRREQYDAYVEVIKAALG